MNIGRTLFWFKDGAEQILDLNDKFFEQGVLLNRLLNEVYDGKKIKFINVNFLTDESYRLNPNTPKNQPYYHGGHLQYYGEFRRTSFENLSWIDKKQYIWENACDYLRKSAKILKNENLTKSIEYAYQKGKEINLNPDFRVIESTLIIYNKELKASVWINFSENVMSSKFTLEDSEKLVFQKDIDKTKTGIEFFLEIYKSIIVDNSNIIIKGHREIEYLPLIIPFSEILIKKNVI